MKKKVPNKYYKALLIVTMLITMVNVAALWITWKNPNNVFGYISGCFTLLALVGCAILAFMNQRILARKQGFIWIIFFAAHITFFVIVWFIGSSVDNAAPALFTVLLAGLIVALFYYLIKDKIGKNKVGYSFPIARENLSSEPDEIEVENAATGKVKFDKPKDKLPEDDGKTSIISL